MEAQRSWTHLHTLAQDCLEKDVALLQDTIIGADGQPPIAEVEEKVSELKRQVAVVDSQLAPPRD